MKGIKDITDVARFTPGISIDNSGTNNISIRGISSSGGAGTTGIYIDDTPIQMRRSGLQSGRGAAEVLRHRPRRGAARPAGHAVRRRLRGRHGALHHHAAEPDQDQRLRPRRGVLYRKAALRATRPASPPAVRSSTARWARAPPSGTAAMAAGSTASIRPRPTRRARSWIRTRITAQTLLIRLAALWAVNDNWTVTPSIYFQNRDQHDVGLLAGLFESQAATSTSTAIPPAARSRTSSICRR